LHLGISKERLVFFFDKELFLDIASMVAGTSTEDNLKKLTLMAEVENDNYYTFIDEIHTIVWWIS
jgi:ATP-dependent Clp protease ATP-binding subunit ClpA